MVRQTPEPLVRRLTSRPIVEDHHNNNEQQQQSSISPSKPKHATTKKKNSSTDSRGIEALKQLFCGGMSGALAKTVTAPLSRLTILYQVHPMVTTKENRPKFSMTIRGGLSKIVERGGIMSLWKGNGTSCLHRFPFSAINFYCYEGMLDILNGEQRLSDEDALLRARLASPPIAALVYIISLSGWPF